MLNYLKVLICIHFLYVINVLFTLYFVNISSLFEFFWGGLPSIVSDIGVNLLYYIISISSISCNIIIM